MMFPPSFSVPLSLPGVPVEPTSAPGPSTPGDPSFSETLSAAVDPRAVGVGDPAGRPGPPGCDASGAMPSLVRPLVCRTDGETVLAPSDAERPDEPVEAVEPLEAVAAWAPAWLSCSGILASTPALPTGAAAGAERPSPDASVAPEWGSAQPDGTRPVAATSLPLLPLAGEVAIGEWVSTTVPTLYPARVDRSPGMAGSAAGISGALIAGLVSKPGSTASLKSAGPAVVGQSVGEEGAMPVPGLPNAANPIERLEPAVLGVRPPERVGSAAPAAEMPMAGGHDTGKTATVPPPPAALRPVLPTALAASSGNALPEKLLLPDAQQEVMVPVVIDGVPVGENVADRPAHRGLGTAPAEIAPTMGRNAGSVGEASIPPVSSGKNTTVNVDDKELKESNQVVGTEIANEVVSMRLEIPAPSSTSSLLPVADLRAGVEGLRGRLGPEASASWVAVGRVVDAADVLWATDRAGVDVKLQFEGEGVWVRVDYRDGEVTATFRAESPELRDRLTAAWQQHVAGAVESRPYRMADPLFEVGAFDRNGTVSAQADVREDAGRRGGNEQAAPEWPTRLAPVAARSVADAPVPAAVDLSPSDLRLPSLRLNVFA